MELWQIILGCVLGVAAGIVLGLAAFAVHANLVRKDGVSLRAAFLTLLGVSPKPARVGLAAMPAPGRRGVPLPVNTEASPAPVPATPLPEPVNVAPPSVPITVVPLRETPPETAPQPPSRPRPAAASDPLEALFTFEDPTREFVLLLLSEFDNNRRVVKELADDNLVPMQTDVWDRTQRLLPSLPSDVRADLESIYGDIRLLNNLVWLCSEFNRHSPSLRLHCVGLAASIADRFDDLIRRSLSPFGATERPFGSSSDGLRQSVAAGQAA